MENPADHHDEVPRDLPFSSIVLLAKDPENLRATIHYLRKRQIESVVCSTLSQSIDHLSSRPEGQARILVFSINIFHPHVELLPMILRKNYGIECIVFFEHDDRKSITKLKTCKARHTIANPLSGPQLYFKLQQLHVGSANEPSSSDSESILVASEKAGGPKERFSLVRDSNLSDAGAATALADDALSEFDAAEEDPPELILSETLLRDCAREALDRICDSQSAPGSSRPVYQAAAMIGVRVGDLQGCLVAAVAQKGDFPSRLLESVLVEFLAALRRQGIELTSEEYTYTEIQNIEDVERIFGQTEVTMHGRAARTDLGIAVVPDARPLADVSMMNDQMIVVEVKNLIPDTPVEFDVFLYLPANRKYLRYVKSGGFISESQSDRLKKRHIKFFYLKKADRENYTKHFASRALSAKKNAA